MMPDVCERLVLVPGRFSSYQSIGHTSLHTSQCNAQMKICFPGLIFAQYKSINIIIIITIIIIIIIITIIIIIIIIIILYQGAVFFKST